MVRENLRDSQRKKPNVHIRIQRVRLACAIALLLGSIATAVAYQINVSHPGPQGYSPLPQFLQAEQARLQLANGLPLQRRRNQEAFRSAVRVLQRDAIDPELSLWTPTSRTLLDEYERIIEATYGETATNDTYSYESVNLAANSLESAIRAAPHQTPAPVSHRGAIFSALLAWAASSMLFSRRNFRRRARLTAEDITSNMPWPALATNYAGEILAVSPSMAEWQKRGVLKVLEPRRSVNSQPGLAKLLHRIEARAGQDDLHHNDLHDDLHLDHWTPNDESHFKIDVVRGSNTLSPILLWSFRDVTEELKKQHDLTERAFHDNLTGLPNRSLFRDRTRQAIERAKHEGNVVSVLFIDLDGFKNVNDSLGHDAGDELIVEMGRRLASLVRTSDSLARLGGDEFAVLIEDPRARFADLVADRIIEAVRLPMRIHGKEVFVSASVGLCEMTPGSAAEDLLRNADTAMYAAKERGKNQAVRFHSVMSQDANERLELDSELRRAIELNQLKLHYQPIVSLGDGRMRGVEALARWMHPTRGLVAPDVFIPIAEESGSILAIGKWVIRNAIREAFDFADLVVHVNVSARQLSDDELASWLEKELEHSGFPASRLVIEITESVVLGDINVAVERLQRFRSMGIGLAIDDFGTGYSSLSYLHRLPIQSVKIDRSFLHGRLSRLDLQADPFVLAILELARTLGFETVAEGVESEEQVAWLAENGCDYGQGYYFARAMPAESIARAATEHNQMTTGHELAGYELPVLQEISDSTSHRGEPMIESMSSGNFRREAQA